MKRQKTLETKAESKENQHKIVMMKTHDLSYFLGKLGNFFFFGNGGFQNLLVNQPTVSIMQLEKDS